MRLICKKQSNSLDDQEDHSQDIHQHLMARGYMVGSDSMRIDREAQRAIRERTKHQIEELEGRIRALTNQQPYQDLQKVTREKEAAEAKNAEL